MGYDSSFIRQHAEDVLSVHGLSQRDASIVVDSMLEAEVCGVSTHGIKMIVPYVHKLESGFFNPDSAAISILRQTPAFSVIDAANTIGAVSAVFAVNECVNKAKESGVHTAFVRNGNTFGPAFYYVEKIAAQGMIGFVCCNAPAAMPAVNGLEPMLGTNPLAFACPSSSEGWIVLDMATSVVAKSKFEQCRLRGESLPIGWALDREGHPTTDPMEAIKGFVLPMAGFKGYGIAMAIDILSGFLSGASYLNKVNKFYSTDNAGMDVGQMFVAIDPTLIYEGDFSSDMDHYIQTIRTSKAVEGKKIALPGDDRVLARSLSNIKGLSLPFETVKKLEDLFGVHLEEL